MFNVCFQGQEQQPLQVQPPLGKSEFSVSLNGLCKVKTFPKSSITMEVGGCVSTSRSEK